MLRYILVHHLMVRYINSSLYIMAGRAPSPRTIRYGQGRLGLCFGAVPVLRQIVAGMAYGATVPGGVCSGGWQNRTIQPTQKLKANLANPTIRRFLIHYFEL